MVAASFSLFMDASDAFKITESIIDDVIEDIEDCADPDFNISDVRLAVKRTLFERLGIDE